MNYNFGLNDGIKRELMSRRITYEEIGKVIHYSPLTIRHWLAKPLTTEREALITGAIEVITRKEDKSRQWHKEQ